MLQSTREISKFEHPPSSHGDYKHFKTSYI